MDAWCVCTCVYIVWLCWVCVCACVVCVKWLLCNLYISSLMCAVVGQLDLVTHPVMWSSLAGFMLVIK